MLEVLCMKTGNVYPMSRFRAEGRDRGIRSLDNVRNFCHKRGHWKADCYALKAKSKQPVLLVVTGNEYK